mmetsp:Transcript_42852/g.110499  ORF Transcript_42852/g.110499 Transcript_42852/m.110499 type:complete len:103 (-) Transcript_42852:23-331(-)
MYKHLRVVYLLSSLFIFGIVPSSFSLFFFSLPFTSICASIVCHFVHPFSHWLLLSFVFLAHAKAISSSSFLPLSLSLSLCFGLPPPFSFYFSPFADDCMMFE